MKILCLVLVATVFSFPLFSQNKTNVKFGDVAASDFNLPKTDKNNRDDKFTMPASLNISFQNQTVAFRCDQDEIVKKHNEQIVLKKKK